MCVCVPVVPAQTSATAAAGALALIVNKSFDAVDALGKTSTQTGIATDTLQAFHLAARESGTTVEGANTALIKFLKVPFYSLSLSFKVLDNISSILE